MTTAQEGSWEWEQPVPRHRKRKPIERKPKAAAPSRVAVTHPFLRHGLAPRAALGLLMTIGASFALQAAVLLNANRPPPTAAAGTVAVPTSTAGAPAAGDASNRAASARLQQVALVLPKPANPAEPAVLPPLPRLAEIALPALALFLPSLDPAEARRNQLRQKVHFKSFTPEACLPPALLGVIYDLAEIYGEVQILSTHRDLKRNARVGGAGRSFHLECRAIDFKVPGPSKDLIAFLRNRPEVGGFKRYPSGYVHIDNGPKRTW